MGLTLPGLTEAMERLDETQGLMVELVNGMNRIATLLEEQNDILRSKP